MENFLKLVEKVQRGNRSLSRAIETIGIAALLLIMVITCADVIGAKAFLKPVPGALDIVMLAQTVAISFGVAATLSVGGHVSVEIFLMHMPPTLSRITTVVTEALSLLLFILIVWQLAIYGYEMHLNGEISPTARIPLYPFAIGIALASIPACIELATQIILTAFIKEDG
jgi:TRAP-type C4-dicarboxylate transport system permease small subunit